MPDNKEQDERSMLTPKEKVSETRHTVVIDDQEISYTAIAGTIILKEPDKEKGEKPKGTIFFIAYTMNDVEDIGKRPLTFSFNGGPGSSSVWLHLGLLGPRRVLLDDEGNAPPPPHQLVNNEYSIFNKTDLVFIDPIGTGFSRAVPGEDEKQFYNFKKDIETAGEFIRRYVTRYKRWSSPKFLAGESYGAVRGAGLTGFLQDRYGMYFNGIMFLSSVLNFQTILFEHGNDLPYILFLPAYTAAAWYHKQLSAELQKDLRETVKEVKEFALTEYTVALMKGSTISDDERQTIIHKLAKYTGLSETYIEQTNLRIEIFRFTKELLRHERRTIGRLDSRMKGIDRDAAGQHFEYDPAITVLQGCYTAALYDYLGRELKFDSDLIYETLNIDVFNSWRYQQHENRFAEVSETLRHAMTKNPYLKVFIACGYYDMGTPALAAEYGFNHLGIDPSLQKNISMAHYEAGHMMYIHRPSLIEMKKDLDEFIESATHVSHASCL
ncbi:MAG: peptidase S10 [Anaerolineaceae bacterium 4572_78]|nr:MAG: peptidase S10 [Anaerolineaceae bacterium 4572_78]